MLQFICLKSHEDTLAKWRYVAKVTLPFLFCVVLFPADLKDEYFGRVAIPTERASALSQTQTVAGMPHTSQSHQRS